MMICKSNRPSKQQGISRNLGAAAGVSTGLSMPRSQPQFLLLCSPALPTVQVPSTTSSRDAGATANGHMPCHRLRGIASIEGIEPKKEQGPVCVSIKLGSWSCGLHWSFPCPGYHSGIWQGWANGGTESNGTGTIK